MTVKALDEEALALVTNHKLSIHFQPIVTSFQHRAIGFEALLKLPQEGSFTSPDDIFHQKGILSADTVHTIDMACMRMALKEGGQMPGNHMLFINVNGPTIAKFLSEYKHKKKSQLLQDTIALSTNRVVLELSENTDPVEMKRIIKLLAPFRESGLSIAVDDCGIRHPWLNLYTWLKPEYIKIDRFFFKNALKWKSHRRIITGICDMMRMLDTMIIGEGIETDTEIEFARTLGMDYLQGYKFSRPMPLKYWQQHLKG